MAIQKYPIGLQNFKSLIQNNNMYVDKTFWLHQLITSYKYYFLSRPRRFGKSLFLSTLYYLFKGEKDLFKGLYVEDKWSFEEYPVVKISFSDIGYRTKGLLNAINNELDSIAEQYDLNLTSESIAIDSKFKELLRCLNKKFQKPVVLLIDEYDKPLIDFLDSENVHIAKENRGILKSFYSILKDADGLLQLVFITGVSKFSQVSIFSDLNNLYDLTIDPKYNEICGISQDELEQYFPLELEKYDSQQIKQWYNGYRWHMSGKTLYNPFSILNFFEQGVFHNFWFSTGTPSFLMSLAKKEKIYDIDGIETSKFVLYNFDLESLDFVPILFQTGYATIKSANEATQRVTLGYPNEEVKISFLYNLTQAYMYGSSYQASNVPFDMLNALKEKDFNTLQKAINQAFSHIPYDLWKKDNEHFYHAIIHLLFSLLGVYIQSEVHTKNGRADAIIHIEEGIFCLEFKLDQSAEAALFQIKEKNYLGAYRESNKPKYAVGINFSSEGKCVEKIVWEEA